MTALVTRLDCEVPDKMATEVHRHLEWKHFTDFVPRPTPNQLLYYQKVCLALIWCESLLPSIGLQKCVHSDRSFIWHCIQSVTGVDGSA